MNSIAGLLFLYLKILLTTEAEKDTRIERRSTLGAIITNVARFVLTIRGVFPQTLTF